MFEAILYFLRPLFLLQILLTDDMSNFNRTTMNTSVYEIFDGPSFVSVFNFCFNHAILLIRNETFWFCFNNGCTVPYFDISVILYYF